MKKIFLSLLIIATLFVTIVYATDSISNNYEDDDFYTDYYDDSYMLDSYEDYENIMNSSGFTSEELEKEYQPFLEYIASTYDEYEAPEIYKAKVLNDAEVEYTYQTDLYSIYEIIFQSLEVELLEGENAGEKINVNYYLMGDNLGNIEVPSVKKGDIIYLQKAEDEDENLIYKVGTTGSTVERRWGVYVLGVIAIVLVIVYGRENGILTVLMSSLIFITMLLVYTDFIYLGKNGLISAMMLGLLITVLLSIIKCGLNAKARKVAFVSEILVLLGAGFTYLVDILLKLRGATFDVTFIAENVIKRNVDFHMLYISSIITILSVFIPLVVYKVFEACENSEEKSFAELIKCSKDAMGTKIEAVTVLLITLLVPKLLLLKEYKYSYTEIINSDILQTELIRLFVIIITIALTVPTGAFVYKLLNKENK